ncbi:MAG: hypothetical protein QM820_19860 [Minicystis sp.]
MIAGRLGVDAVVEGVVVGEVLAVEEAAVVGGDHVRISVRGGLGQLAGEELDEVRRHQPIREGEVNPLDARGLDEVEIRALERGRGAEIVIVISGLRLLGVGEGAGADGEAVEILECGRERRRLADGEAVRLGLLHRACVEVAADGDQLEVAIEEHLHVVVEQLDPARCLPEHDDDPAAPGVVDLLHPRRRERLRREAVARRVAREVVARGRLRREAGEDRRAVRAMHCRARGPEEGGHAALRVGRGDERGRRLLPGQRGDRDLRRGRVSVVVGQGLRVGEGAEEQRSEGEQATSRALHQLDRLLVLLARR